ncbi:MAG: hypothetical protein KDG52_00515 [Rhodocyclaceae bacterium]|nr:hypothetical protein [Rhodocyclaceae bacterium]
MKSAQLKRLTLVFATAGLMAAGSAHADLLTTDLASQGLGTGLNFTFNLNGDNLSRIVGTFDVTNLTTGSSFLAFCADILTPIHNLEISQVNPGGIEFDAISNLTFFNGTVGNDVQALFDQRYGSLDLTDNTQTAAFQISLWEIIHDNADKTIGGGDLIWDVPQADPSGALKTDVLTTAGIWLAGLSDPTVDDTYDLTVWQPVAGAAESQPYIQASLPSSSVPVPGTLALGLASLIGFGVVRRRR